MMYKYVTHDSQRSWCEDHVEGDFGSCIRNSDLCRRMYATLYRHVKKGSAEKFWDENIVFNNYQTV